MEKISPKQIEENAIELIADKWMLVTAGTIDNFNTMTANWGAVGKIWMKDVAFVFIRPQRYTYEFTETNELMTLSFFNEEYKKALQICGTKSGRDIDKIKETELSPFETENKSVSFHEASLILECRKLYAEQLKENSFLDTTLVTKIYPDKDFHKMYVVEIINVWTK